MNKFFKAMCITLMGVCAATGFAACGKDKGDSSIDSQNSSQSSPIEQIKDAPVITNKPAGNTLTMTAGANTYQFTVEYEGAVTWVSTVSSVATISEDGLLTMLGEGVTEIIAKDETTGLSDSVVLTIMDDRAEETLAITGAPAIFRVGDAAVQLSVTSSVNGQVAAMFTSSNPNVATVSQTGLLTAVAKGVTTITATNESGLSASIEVEVLGPAVEAIDIAGVPKFGALVGDFLSLSVTAAPADCEAYELDWSISNEDIACFVDGQLLAKSVGECTVTATVKGTNIKAEKTLTVGELSARSENFRYATAGVANVMNIGPTITFTNVDGEIIEYGEDQALKVTTRANNAYNAVVISFQDVEIGNYKLSYTYKVIEGRHTGAMVMDADTAEFGYAMATTALGNDNYCFYFEQAEAGEKKIAISAQQWTTEGVILLDNIVLEQVNEISAIAAGSVNNQTFDNIDLLNGQNSDIGGVYVTPRKFATELVEDNNGGKALKVTRVEGGYAWIALSLGDITPGNYTLTLDIKNYDYQGIVQVSQINNVNGLWKHHVLQDIKYEDADTIFEHAGCNGDTYTLHFSVAESYENFALSLSTNLAEYTGESIVIDNVKLEKATTSQTIDFETETMPIVHKFASAGAVDFGKAWIVTSEEITEQGYVTEGGNTYYSAKFLGWNTYSLINLGTLEAGKYIINMDVKLLRGTMNGRFILRINGQQVELTENDYVKNGDTYTFIVTLDETASEFCIGYRSVKDNNADFTLAYDNISIAEYVAPENVEITTYTENIMKGESFDFAASVSPTESANVGLIWSVDDSTIGAIDTNGCFTAKGVGECVVTVTVAGTNISASVTVTVTRSTLPPDEGGDEEDAVPDGYDDWFNQI